MLGKRRRPPLTGWPFSFARGAQRARPGVNTSSPLRKLTVNYIIDDQFQLVIHFSMATDTELLTQRLDAIRTEKSSLMKRVEELSAAEERINYALEVFRSVIADVTKDEPPKSHVLVAGSGSYSITGHAPTLTVEPSPAATDEQRPRVRQSLESMILGTFNEKTGMTSGEVADTVELFALAKRDSILSTLSRMTGKGLVRREGKLYFRVTKGEGSGVVGTTEPSGATTSGDGLDIQQDEELRR